MGITRIYEFSVVFKDGSAIDEDIYGQDYKKAKDLAIGHACWEKYGSASDKIVKNVRKVKKK